VQGLLSVGEEKAKINKTIEKRMVHRGYTEKAWFCKLLKKKEEIVVEAAGVEPASEKACRKEPTCVAGSAISERRHGSRQA
jgi:hypothetical protein